MSNTYRRFAVVLMLVGAAAAVTPALAGVTVDADRPVAVDVVDDPNAILGIDAKSDVGQLKWGSEKEIATLSNNIGETANVTVRVVDIPDANDTILSVGPNNLEVADGESISSNAKCNQTKSLGERNVVFGVRSVGSQVSVTNATFTVRIDIKCGSGSGKSTSSGLAAVGATNLTDGDASQPQTFEFQLTEDLAAGETVTITIEKGAQNKRLNYTGGTFTTDAPGSLSDKVSSKDHVITFTAEENISRYTTIQIDASGVDASGSKADNKGKAYNVVFERSDFDNTESTEFHVK